MSWRFSWTLYLVGSLLVFGSWVSLVPTWLGWVGWLMALSGWAAGSLPGRRRASACARQVTPYSRADEIAKLDLLRKEGILSEAEFQDQKERILRGG